MVARACRRGQLSQLPHLVIQHADLQCAIAAAAAAAAAAGLIDSQRLRGGQLSQLPHLVIKHADLNAPNLQQQRERPQQQQQGVR
jgi:hypothetical protein